jgi:hypothetical protein
MADHCRLKQWGEESKIIVRDYCYDRIIAGLKEALAAICNK